MKFFSAVSAILVSLASTAFAGPLDDSGLGTSTTIVQGATSNDFTVTFVGGARSTEKQFAYNFYSFDCETTNYGDGSSEGFSPVAFGNAGGTADPIMTFTVDMSTIQDSDTFTSDGADSKVELCVRNSVKTPDGTTEVNFQDSQITLTMDLTANVFTSIGIEKKEKHVEREAQQAYAITTTLCDGTPNPVTQGSLVTVCMEPDSTDVSIASLTAFTWTQTGGTGISQDAIANDVASNPLSTGCDCPAVKPTLGATCGFASVLYAEFFAVDNPIEGNGVAVFEVNRRRLNAGNNDEAEARLLQGLESEVFVAVPIETAKFVSSKSSKSTKGFKGSKKFNKS